MELKAEAPATQWIGPVDPYHSEKVIHNRKEKRVRYKDKAKWPHIFSLARWSPNSITV